MRPKYVQDCRRHPENRQVLSTARGRWHSDVVSMHCSTVERTLADTRMEAGDRADGLHDSTSLTWKANDRLTTNRQMPTSLWTGISQRYAGSRWTGRDNCAAAAAAADDDGQIRRRRRRRRG
jgi:hypothetical protein